MRVRVSNYFILLLAGLRDIFTGRTKVQRPERIRLDGVERTVDAVIHRHVEMVDEIDHNHIFECNTIRVVKLEAQQDSSANGFYRVIYGKMWSKNGKHLVPYYRLIRIDSIKPG